MADNYTRIETGLFCWVIGRAYRQIRDPPLECVATVTATVHDADQTSFTDGSPVEVIDLELAERTVVQKSPVDYGSDVDVLESSETASGTRTQSDTHVRADALYDDMYLDGSDSDWQEARSSVKRKKVFKTYGRGDKLPKLQKTTFKKTQRQLREKGTKINYSLMPLRDTPSPVGGMQSDGQLEEQPGWRSEICFVYYEPGA